MDALGETTINFKPYNKTQLTHILMRRATRGLKHTKLDISESGEYDFKSDVISEEQLRECANMAARERGSARQALQYLGGAAMIADNVGANQITTDHIRKSEQKVRQEFVQDILTDHTRDDLLTFCGVLWCVANDSTPTKAAAIHNNYSSVCSVLDERSKVQRRMTERLKDLDLTGAIEMSKETGGQRGGEYFVIELSLPFVETLDVMQHEDPFAEKFSVIIEEIRDNAERNDVI
jgi:cell division control protein 6